MAKALWEAPFAVLSHDKFENEDPVFTYANKVYPVLCTIAALPLRSLLLPFLDMLHYVMQAALDLFEATWDELVGMHSRKSAAEEVEVSH